MTDRFEIRRTTADEDAQMGIYIGFAGLQVHHTLPTPQEWAELGATGEPRELLSFTVHSVLLADQRQQAEFPPMLFEPDGAAIIRAALETALEEAGLTAAYLAAYDQVMAQGRDTFGND